MRVLTRQAGNLLKLASLSYPDALITALARQRAEDPQCRIERLHFYPSAASLGPRAGSRRSARARSRCTTTAAASRSTALPSEHRAAMAHGGAPARDRQRRALQPRPVAAQQDQQQARRRQHGQAGRVRSHWMGGQSAGIRPFSISAWKPTRLLA